jgi:hypothetical protein
MNSDASEAQQQEIQTIVGLRVFFFISEITGTWKTTLYLGSTKHRATLSGTTKGKQYDKQKIA